MYRLCRPVETSTPVAGDLVTDNLADMSEISFPFDPGGSENSSVTDDNFKLDSEDDTIFEFLPNEKNTKTARVIYLSDSDNYPIEKINPKRFHEVVAMVFKYVDDQTVAGKDDMSNCIRLIVNGRHIGV